MAASNYVRINNRTGKRLLVDKIRVLECIAAVYCDDGATVAKLAAGEPVKCGISTFVLNKKVRKR